MSSRRLTARTSNVLAAATFVSKSAVFSSRRCSTSTAATRPTQASSSAVSTTARRPRREPRRRDETADLAGLADGGHCVGRQGLHQGDDFFDRYPRVTATDHGVISLHDLHGASHVGVGADFLDDAGERRTVVLGQVEAHGVEVLVHLNVTSEGGTDHAADQLRDVGAVGGRAVGQHHLGARAVPPGVEAAFEQDDPGIGVRTDRRGGQVANGPRSDGQGCAPCRRHGSTQPGRVRQ